MKNPEELAQILDRLARLSRAAAEQIRLGNFKDIKISSATADIHAPDFGHLVLGPFRIHYTPPPVIDVEVVRVESPPAPPAPAVVDPPTPLPHSL